MKLKVKKKIENVLRYLTKVERRELLWTNPNPATAYTAGNPVRADVLSAYDAVEISFFLWVGYQYICATDRAYKGDKVITTAIASSNNFNTGSRPDPLARSWEFSETNGVSIYGGVEANFASSGSFATSAQVLIPYKIYGIKLGGVLRNLSIFKAFRHFMSLQKGGGVDGQTGCKKGVTENSSDAQCSAYSGAHYASRVRNDSRIQWSQPIRFGRCARWLFSACSCCFMEYWSDRYALPLRCVHHFDKRRAVSVQRRKHNKESWYCSPVNALHKEYIAFSERRCAA